MLSILLKCMLFGAAAWPTAPSRPVSLPHCVAMGSMCCEQVVDSAFSKLVDLMLELVVEQVLLLL